MSLAAAVAVCLIIASAVAGVSSHARNQVSISVTTADVRDGSETRADTLLLWNLNERSRPIGHAVKTCVKVGSGGILGGGVMNCTMVVSLPLGKVVAVGTVHNLRRYTLTITGGTGRYVSARGPLFVRSVSGNGVRRLTFSA